ncbi:MAG: metalloregulator ArsR/SmtB family transcription factor [Propionibacteriales bacterium]|nr:metalloregulator ArsR/SmtB family transcription factor [Propionibacteriales bacterium]
MHETIRGFRMPEESAVEDAARTLRLLADPTRLKICWALMQGESNVACLAEVSGTHPSAVSQHIAKLRLAGLVHARREGNFVYYKLSSDQTVGLLQDALASSDPHLQDVVPKR